VWSRVLARPVDGVPEGSTFPAKIGANGSADFLVHRILPPTRLGEKDAVTNTRPYLNLLRREVWATPIGRSWRRDRFSGMAARSGPGRRRAAAGAHALYRTARALLRQDPASAIPQVDSSGFRCRRTPTLWWASISVCRNPPSLVWPRGAVRAPSSKLADGRGSAVDRRRHRDDEAGWASRRAGLA